MKCVWRTAASLCVRTEETNCWERFIAQWRHLVVVTATGITGSLTGTHAAHPLVHLLDSLLLWMNDSKSVIEFCTLLLRDIFL